MFPRLIIIPVVGLVLSLISIPLSSTLMQHLFPAFVTTRDGNYIFTPGLAFALSATPKLSHLVFHIQEFIIPGNPARNYKINEYPVITTNGSSNNNTHYSPTELFISTSGGIDDIYISDHDNHTVTIFDPTLKTFKTFPVFNPKALPFGMAIDRNGYLWVAEHTTNKIAVIDPKTGSSREVEIPKQNLYIQFLTSDSKGNIWFAEQQGNSLGVITSTSPPTKTS